MKKKNVEEMLEHIEYQINDSKKRKDDVIFLAVKVKSAEFLQDLVENHLKFFDAWED